MHIHLASRSTPCRDLSVSVSFQIRAAEMETLFGLKGVKCGVKPIDNEERLTVSQIHRISLFKNCFVHSLTQIQYDAVDTKCSFAVS